jgi:hypothetical protein
LEAAVPAVKEFVSLVVESPRVIIVPVTHIYIGAVLRHLALIMLIMGDA